MEAVKEKSRSHSSKRKMKTAKIAVAESAMNDVKLQDLDEIANDVLSHNDLEEDIFDKIDSINVGSVQTVIEDGIKKESDILVRKTAPEIENSIQKCDAEVSHKISEEIIPLHQIVNMSVKNNSFTLNASTSEKNFSLVETSSGEKNISVAATTGEKSISTRPVYPNLKSIQYFESMNDIIGTQTLVKTYADEYLNKTVKEANRRYQEFLGLLSELHMYPLHDLVHQYESAKKMSLGLRRKLRHSNSLFSRKKDSLWKSVKKEVFSKGKCDDGYLVKISHSYMIKELDQATFDEVVQILNNLESSIVSDAFHAYSEELLKLRIEYYLNSLLRDITNPEKVPSNKHHMPYSKGILKKCISILFNYQRQPIEDKNFLEMSRQWLKVLVSFLLTSGDINDHLFITNHVIRCPNDIHKWAANFVQIPCLEVWAQKEGSTFNCFCLDYSLLVLYLILNPAPDRDNFLRNVKINQFSDALDCTFIVLDSEGEEEESSEVVKNWSDEDVVSLLKQISITRIYNHILLQKEGGTVSVKQISESDMLKLFAYSTALVNILFMGLENYCDENSVSSYDYLCNLLRHAVGYVSDYWQNYIKMNGSIKPAFQAEYDRFLFHAVFKILQFQKLGIWKCLSKLPFNSVSRKMFWNILWLFHHSEGTEEEIYSAKDADRRLLEISEQMRFFQKMKMYDAKNGFHILNMYEKIALSCNGNEELINFLIHEICEVSFVESCLRDKFCKEAIVVISNVTKTYPQLVSFLLKEFNGKADEVNSCALKLFKEVNLLKWKPDMKDLSILSEWLLSSKLSQPQSHLARLIIKKLNWNYDAKGSLILPLQMHQEIAILLVKAYLKFDADGNKWIVSRGVEQMLQFAAIEIHGKEDEGFIHWVWETLFSLKLHALDKNFPPWVQIYDGFIDTGSIPDLLEDVRLTSLQHAFESKHPAACYVVLAMTRIGHSVENLIKQGLQCLSILVQHQQYPAAIHSLYYMLPFFVKKSDQLLLETEFLKSMNYLITADMSVISGITSGAVVGIVLHKLAAMIKHQILQAWNLTVECAVPLISLWIKILLKLSAPDKNSSFTFKDSVKQVYFLLDVVAKISFMDYYARNSTFDLVYSFGKPLVSSSANIQPSLWERLFGYNNEMYGILNKQTLPEYPWLAWYILSAEIKQKSASELWNLVQEHMIKDKAAPLTVTLKKACACLKINPPPLESLPIYRWALQIMSTSPSHPSLPLMWQQFFLYYFERRKLEDQYLGQSIGDIYFKTGAQLVVLNKMKARLKESEEYYNKLVENGSTKALKYVVCASERGREEIIEESKHQLNLLKLFRAFKAWIGDESLHSSTLCFSALQPVYYSERLKLILENDQRTWFECVSIDSIKEELNSKLHSWQNRSMSFVLEDNGMHPNMESFIDCISRHLKEYDHVKPIESQASFDVPPQEITDTFLTSWEILVQLIEKDQLIIFGQAKHFIDLIERLKQLNFNYKNWVPQKYKNEDCEITLNKVCHKGEKSNGCAGAATFKLHIQKYTRDDRIHDKIETNRAEHNVILDQILKLPVHELCLASVRIENCIKALSKKMNSASPEDAIKYRNMGISLFYHQMQTIDKIISSVADYSPSRQFFASIIESLGKEFIESQEDQLLNLVESILKYPIAGLLASPLFNPKLASISVFLDVYKKVALSIANCSRSTLLVLLSKVDLQFWLKEKQVDFNYRKQLFQIVCNALISCGLNPSNDLMPIYEVFKKHYNILLSFMFPELYSNAVTFLFDGMEKGTLNVDIWYESIYCFGCTLLSQLSTVEDIDIAVRKFAENQRLPPDQQIFVSCQPLNFYQVTETLDIIHHKFAKRAKASLYQECQSYIKPLGLFIAVLNHAYLSLLLVDVFKQEQNLSVSHIWQILNQSFCSWLHPVVEGAHLRFPWSDDRVKDAEFMFKLFTMCLKYFHDQLLIDHNCEKYILSYLWSHYVQIYVSPGYRHYSVSLCHTELLKLPWHQFHPDAEDIEGMCKVLQSDLKESKEFLAKISLEIPWLEVMSYISSTKPPEYVGKTLGTLAKLLIISGWDTSVKKKKFQQNDLKQLESLPWYLLHFDDIEALLSLYFSGSDIVEILLGISQNGHEIHLFQFLKFLCCMAANSSTDGCCNPKRLLYLHKYTSSLSICISAKKELFLKNSDNFKTMLPSLLKDIEVVVSKGVKSDEIINNALPLVREVIGFLNSISEPALEKVATDSVVSWLTTNHRSPLLLPCLKSSCCCLNTMANMVIICECCVTSRFADLQDAAEASSIFQLISSYFQVPYGHCDEFVQMCVEKKAFLTLYCYVLLKRSNMTSMESKKQLLWSLVDWIRRARVSESSEAKSLLLWDKILELCIMLTSEDEIQSVQEVLLSFCNELNSFSEDRINTGFFGAIGLGPHSELSVNFRFMCCVMVAYLLLQIPDNASIRLEAMASGYLVAEDNAGQKKSSKLPQPSQAALKALEKLNALLDKKPYSALRCQVTDAISCVRDPKNSLVESRQFLKHFALLAFPKDNFLHALC